MKNINPYFIIEVTVIFENAKPGSSVLNYQSIHYYNAIF